MLSATVPHLFARVPLCAHRYFSREQFEYDLELIFKNSELYNGPKSKSDATQKAELVVLVSALIC
jgi:hypothetical protein